MTIELIPVAQHRTDIAEREICVWESLRQQVSIYWSINIHVKSNASTTDQPIDINGGATLWEFDINVTQQHH